MYSIGDNISGKVYSISQIGDRVIVYIDIKNNEWKCKLHWNQSERDLIKRLNVGDDVDGWIISKQENEKLIAMGQSNFGMFPPRPPVLIRYFNSLLYFKKILSDNLEIEIDSFERELFSEMKGLINRCKRKDQWDWLVIYRAFGFSDDSEVQSISKIIENLSFLRKQFNKQEIDNVKFKEGLYNFLLKLKEHNFLERVRNAIVFLNDESVNWEIMKVTNPLKSLEDNNLLYQEKKITISLVKINSHIRHGVSMSEKQKNKIIELLKRTNIKLSDGTLLTLANFNDFDWDTQTVVSDYEKDVSQTPLDNSPKMAIISDLIETNIKKERANIIHSQLVNMMATRLLEIGLEPKSNGLLDLFTQKKEDYLLFEMKSIHAKNEISQIRKAIAQLYEYRYLHSFNNAELCIVLNNEPTEKWLLEYILNDRNMLVCWISKGGFDCPISIRGRLDGIVL